MMMVEYGLGAVLVVMYVLAWMALVLLGLELAPQRRFNAMPFASADVDDRSGREKSAQPELAAENGWGEEGARPSSLVPFYKCKVDPSYLLQLKRAVEIANEETVRNYGPLPPGGLPVRKKTRPNVPYRDFRGNLEARASLIEEEDEMKLGLVAAMTALAISGVTVGDNEQLQQNAIANSVAPITRTATGVDKAQTIEVRNELPSRSAQSPAGEKKLIFHELALAAGVDCKEPDTGLACSAGDYEAGDYYEVKLSPSCGQDGLFAAVTNKKGTALLDRVPPKDTVSPATLSEGQLVCIQATALIKGTPSWYYVRVVPADSLQGSARNRLLATHGDREVWWHAKHEGGACRLNEPWEFSGACAVGWADAGDFDVFSNGP